MTGGLMQLVAYGAQDIYLTGNPMITFFKTVYRRHTNFAMESIQQTINGTVNFGSSVTSTISRNGDLITGAYLKVTLPHLIHNVGVGSSRWIDSVGHYLVKSVRLEIGGQQIDEHYGDWLEIWAQLSVPASQRAAYFEMIGLDGLTGLQTPQANQNQLVAPGANVTSGGQRQLLVPLQFFFCRNVGLALPLIALQYHEVTVHLTLEALNNLAFTSAADAQSTSTGFTTSGNFNLELWVDYIYLDTDERRRFAQVSHEYLIEQLQFSGDEAFSSSGLQHIELNINHTVKELIWVSRLDRATSMKQWSNYTTTIADTTLAGTSAELIARPRLAFAAGPTDATNANIQAYLRGVSRNLCDQAILQLNGHDRFAAREGTYFNRQQTFDHHTSSPASIGINVYSFALKPEDHQPSGTCNFSRIDNARLSLTISANASVPNTAGTPTNGGDAIASVGVTRVYATNYNVLRIMSGMGGLAYSN